MINLTKDVIYVQTDNDTNRFLFHQDFFFLRPPLFFLSNFTIYKRILGEHIKMLKMT